MSIDTKTDVPPLATAPKRSGSGGSRKWLWGGLGCLGLLLILCVGGVVAAFLVGQDITSNNPAVLQAEQTILSSDSISNALGSPVTVSTPIPTGNRAAGEKIVVIFTADVVGSEKTGVAVIEVQGVPLNNDSWEVVSIKVTGPDGENVPVDELVLDINLEEGETVEQ